MKVSRLQAEKVHGYLPIDIEFFDDITFLTGLNGSGKTSALRLLMALLTPNLDELGSISFSTAAVTIREPTGEAIVKAVKTPDGITLSESSLPDVLTIGSSDLEIYSEARRRDEHRSPILEKYQSHPIFQRIKAISTPMFLGLDRRFYDSVSTSDEMNDLRRREALARRFWSDDPTTRGAAVAALVEVNYLVMTRMQEVRASQEQLDERLRSQFFAKAFEYKPSDGHLTASGLPSRAEIDGYRRQLTKIERAAENIRIPVPEIQSALTGFFEKMSQVVESLEKTVVAKGPTKKSPRKSPHRSSIAVLSSSTNMNAYIEWIMNKPQADRILEHLKLLDEYIENRNALHNSINRFLLLVNGFFLQTNKTVSVENNGALSVSVSGRLDRRPISALSSGERQLLVMLAHLSFNPNLDGSGIFIVDEPELSLHIDWQEKFVDAICKANPKVQLILATHSPAIILDRVEHCRTLSEGRNA